MKKCFKMPFKIRKARKSDILPCSRIFLKEFNRLGGKWSLATARARVEDAFKTRSKGLYCLTLDKKIIGLLLTEPFYSEKGKYLYILGFAIDSKHQGKGYGVEALKFIQDRAKKEGYKAIELDANRKNKAIKIYEKFGFKKTDYRLMVKDI